MRTQSERLPRHRRDPEPSTQRGHFPAHAAHHQALGQRERHLLERHGLPGRRQLGYTRRARLSVLPERLRGHPRRQVLLGLLRVGVAELDERNGPACCAEADA